MLQKLKELFKKDTKWQDMYEETRKESMKWEFKFNKYVGALLYCRGHLYVRTKRL